MRSPRIVGSLLESYLDLLSDVEPKIKAIGMKALDGLGVNPEDELVVDRYEGLSKIVRYLRGGHRCSDG